MAFWGNVVLAMAKISSLFWSGRRNNRLSPHWGTLRENSLLYGQFTQTHLLILMSFCWNEAPHPQLKVVHQYSHSSALHTPPYTTPQILCLARLQMTLTLVCVCVCVCVYLCACYDSVCVMDPCECKPLTY